MSTATIKRPRAAAVAKNPGDHRASAMATVKAITEDVSDIHAGADGMADYAWSLLDVAIQLGYQLVERNEPAITMHAGGLKCVIRDFQAALHGTRALIMEMAEKDWTPDDAAVMVVLRKAGPQLADALANLELQRHWEVDLGNKPAEESQTAKVTQDESLLDDPYMALVNARDVIASRVDHLKDAAPFLGGVLALIEPAAAAVCSVVENDRHDQIEPARNALASAAAVMSMFREAGNDDGCLHAAEMLMELATRSFNALYPEAAHA